MSLRQELPYLTDERLKSYLDTNQQHREQMCLAVLRTDKRFSEVRPRHPRGGPDGGRDIDAVFGDGQIAFGAVGFINQANDSDEQKKRISTKFGDDLASALGADPKPQVFVFFTNINLTLGEKGDLIAQAKAAGLVYCDIFDRERLKIILDSVDDFSIRFQYLGLPLSEAEQASFFAKWGDEIQELISTGFQSFGRTLDRIHFLLEASGALSTLSFALELDRTYSADEIGHFRAFCCMYLREPKNQIWSILFGSSDKADRMMSNVSDEELASEQAGIKHGISGGQWENYWEANSEDDAESDNDSASDSDEKDGPEYNLVGKSSSIGLDAVEYISIAYTHGVVHFFTKLNLQDIDRAQFIFFLNKSLAERVKCIHAYANGYELQTRSQSEFRVDNSQFDPSIPAKFTDVEVSDAWVRIRPVNASAFSLSFRDQTPARLSFPRTAR